MPPTIVGASVKETVMFTRPMTCAALALTLAAPAATADSSYRGYARGNDTYDFARVVDVQPVVRQVRIDVPRRECWTEMRYDQPAPQGHRGLVGPIILGALIGGTIGHQFGHGHHNDRATVAGAIVGSAIGHDIGERRRSQGAYSQSQGYEVERCEERIEQTYEERIDGYEVEYEYAGQRFHTRLPYDPGERIRVRVAVTPA
jgi:uncharacterized protein YcfJ